MILFRKRFAVYRRFNTTITRNGHIGRDVTGWELRKTFYTRYGASKFAAESRTRGAEMQIRKV